MNDNETLIDALDQLLPQLQCGLCQFSGCKPYAAAMVKENEAFDRCLPGGVEVLKALAALLKQDPAPFLEGMALKTKPPVIAVIREAECIGCTKCIQACPVDAIIGANKQMHTILADVCTGCELCIKPCPVDCIDLKPTLARSQQFKEQSRERYHQHKTRLEHQSREEFTDFSIPVMTETVGEREAVIKAAVERARLKKSSSVLKL